MPQPTVPAAIDAAADFMGNLKAGGTTTLPAQNAGGPLSAAAHESLEPVAAELGHLEEARY